MTNPKKLEQDLWATFDATAKQCHTPPPFVPRPLHVKKVSQLWLEVFNRQAHLVANEKNRTIFSRWLSRFDYLETQPLLIKLRAVNDAINKGIVYSPDLQGYNKKEYWATPLETLKYGQGDCEDYAILKYYVLRYLGVSADSLYLASVDIGKGKISHAVLMADAERTKKPSAFLVLDNMRGRTEIARERHAGCQPYFLLNETGIFYRTGPTEFKCYKTYKPKTASPQP
jgi:predicted transglutaminase-like cysteine proteinase